MDDEWGAMQGPRGQRPRPFRAVLTPHRSLTADGFLVVMGLLGGISVITGSVFLFLGAWPVVGFLGLDVLIVYVAFKLNYRSGRLYEVVELLPDAMSLTRVHPSGRLETYDFDPLWVRVLLRQQYDGRSSLFLASHEREIGVAGFLTDDERRRFAAVLRGELSARRDRLRP